eukprot:gene10197-21252_t
MPRKTFFASSVATVVGYSILIEYRKSSNKDSSLGNFPVGSADDMISDSLKSGDLIFFKRRWYNYHVPKAAVIKLHQVLFGSEFDHCGIIIQAPLGVPYVLELTDGGHKLTKFSSRVLQSQAHQILVIPIEPRVDLPMHQRQELTTYAMEKIHKTYNLGSSELVLMACGLISGVTSQLLGIPTTTPFCPSSQLVIDVLNKVGIESCKPDGGLHMVVCDDFIDNKGGPSLRENNIIRTERQIIQESDCITSAYEKTVRVEVEAVSELCNKYHFAIVHAIRHNRRTIKEEKEEAEASANDPKAELTPQSKSIGDIDNNNNHHIAEYVIERWSNELANKRQYIGFVRSIEDDVTLCYPKIVQRRENLQTKMLTLKVIVSATVSVPKEQGVQCPTGEFKYSGFFG